MNLNWARNFTGSVKVVFYDDLVNNIEPVLRSILEFLEFPIDEVITEHKNQVESITNIYCCLTPAGPIKVCPCAKGGYFPEKETNTIL